MKRWATITIPALLWVLFQAGGSFAASVSAEARYWPSAGGYMVEFTYINSTWDDRLSSVLAGDGSPVQAWAPVGWNISMSVRNDVEWWTVEQEYGIAPQSSMGGFVIADEVLPAQYHWWASGTFTYSGYVTPLPIPEPGSLFGLVAGLAALAGLAVKRRR